MKISELWEGTIMELCEDGSFMAEVRTVGRAGVTKFYDRDVLPDDKDKVCVGAAFQWTVADDGVNWVRFSA